MRRVVRVVLKCNRQKKGVFISWTFSPSPLSLSSHFFTYMCSKQISLTKKKKKKILQMEDSAPETPFQQICDVCVFNMTECLCNRETFDDEIMDDFEYDDDNEREEDQSPPKTEKRAGQPRRRTKTNSTGRGVAIGPYETVEEAEKALLEEGHKELLLRRSILKKQRVGKDERPDYSAGGKAKAAADDVKGVWQIARGGKEVIADYLQKVGLLPFTMKCNKCDKEMPRKLFWTGVNGKPRNWPCFQCNTTSCKHSNGKRRRVQMKFPSPCEIQNTEDKDGKPAGEDGEDDEDGEDCEDDEDYGDDEDDEDDNKKDDKKTKNKKKKKKNTHTKLKMDELLILLWGCHTDLPVKYLSDFLDIDPSTITAYKQACVENAIVLVEELQAGMTLGGPGKEVEIDEFSVGLVHFVKTEAGSTIDKCAYQRLIGATERGSRKCYLRKLPLVVQDWLKPGQTVTLPSGVGNFTNKRAKKVPPPPPPLSNTELKAFLDEEFILLGKPANPQTRKPVNPQTRKPANGFAGLRVC